MKKKVPIQMKIITMFFLVIIISFVFFKNTSKIKYNEPTIIQTINIEKTINDGDIERYVGSRVIFECTEIKKHNRYTEMYYVYINDNSRYNVFLYKNIKIQDDDMNKKKKITGFIDRVRNGIIFIKPDKIDIIE
jgi:hypothetical protein